MPKRAFTVERCSEDAVRGVIERYHYLHRWPDPRSLPFAYRLMADGKPYAPDLRPWGVVVMKQLQHQRQAGLFGYPGLPTKWQVLDLARVWVHPILQEETWLGTDRKGEVRMMNANAFSRMVSQVVRRVQRDWIDHHPPPFPELPYHIELVVSYCDRVHHEGVGYRASGFELFGQTSDGTKDIYLRRLKCPRWQYESAQMDLLEAVHA